MRRAVIHIGIDKTGTTTLQRSLHAARGRLLQAGVLYPSIAANHSICLSTLFRAVPPRALAVIEPEAVTPAGIEAVRRRYRQSLQRELDLDWRVLVLSAEGLCDVGPPAIERLRAFLAPHVGERIRVLAYVRHPLDWIHSAAQERLKAGETLDQLLERPWRPDWRRRFTPWLQAFGRERFVLRSFEAALKTGLLVSLAEAGDLPEVRDLPSASPANASLSMEAALWLDARNRRDPSRDQALLQRLMRQPGRPFRLPAELEAAALATAREEVAWLQETFGVDDYADLAAAAAGD